jgi:hypothetical protein
VRLPTDHDLLANRLATTSAAASRSSALESDPMFWLATDWASMTRSLASAIACVGGVEHVSAVADVDEQLILLVEDLGEVERAGGPARILAGREKLPAARDAVLLLEQIERAAPQGGEQRVGAQRVAHAIHVD